MTDLRRDEACCTAEDCANRAGCFRAKAGDDNGRQVMIGRCDQYRTREEIVNECFRQPHR